MIATVCVTRRASSESSISILFSPQFRNHSRRRVYTLPKANRINWRALFHLWTLFNHVQILLFNHVRLNVALLLIIHHCLFTILLACETPTFGRAEISTGCSTSLIRIRISVTVDYSDTRPRQYEPFCSLAITDSNYAIYRNVAFASCLVVSVSAQKLDDDIKHSIGIRYLIM